MPLVEAFHKRARSWYAATAVPATMDGGGVLYRHKNPAGVAALMESLTDDAVLADEVLIAQDAALERLKARTSEACSCDLSSRRFRDRGEAHPWWRMTFGGNSRWPKNSRRSGSIGRAPSKHCRWQTTPQERRTWGTAQIVHQWLPAAHRGDAVGDNARDAGSVQTVGPLVGDLRADD